MNKLPVSRIILILILISASLTLPGQSLDYKKIKWESERIAPGLKWKSSHYYLSDSVPQNINLLIINTKRRELSISYTPAYNLRVSSQAEKANAIAAVNGGFFNISNGGSVTYIKSGGEIAEKDTAKTWRRNSNMTGSLLIDQNSYVNIDTARTNSWYDSHPEYLYILLTGPLLISDKAAMPLPSTPLVINRHPRTAIGKTGMHRIIIVTLDGRTGKAAGMTLAELTDFMLSLRCEAAVNLDGGGSTTMWIAGKPHNGVVNMPCDNKKFDHEGERAVSNILVIR